jgi:hypothetical protein
MLPSQLLSDGQTQNRSVESASLTPAGNYRPRSATCVVATTEHARRTGILHSSRSWSELQLPSILTDPFRIRRFRQLARCWLHERHRGLFHSLFILPLGWHLPSCWMSEASAPGLSDAIIEGVQSWFVDNFLDGETQLFGGPNNVLKALDSSLQICGGQPSVVTRSSTVQPNGACPDVLTDVNASCTCLTGLDDNDDAWMFRVRSKESDSNATSFPSTQSAADTLAIDAIQTLYVPDTLQKL